MHLLYLLGGQKPMLFKAPQPCSPKGQWGAFGGGASGGSQVKGVELSSMGLVPVQKRHHRGP